MSTDLIPVDLNQLPATQRGSDEDFEKSARRTGFLQRLHLFSKGKDVDAQKIPPGTFGIPEADKIVNLGNKVDILPLAKRLKALDLSDTKNIKTSYDPNSEEYQRIEKNMQEVDNSRCLAGTSFLVYERSSGRFLELYLGSKSTVSIAGDVAAYLPLTQADINQKQAAGADVSRMEPHFAEPCTLTVRLTTSKKSGFSWHVPDVQTCSVPFTNVPPTSVIVDEINRFLNPSTNDVEEVEEDETNSRAR